MREKTNKEEVREQPCLLLRESNQGQGIRIWLRPFGRGQKPGIWVHLLFKAAGNKEESRIGW